MKTKLVILDFDGVIVDSFPLVPKIYGEIARQLSVPKDILEKNKIIDGDFFESDYRKALAKLLIVEPERITRAELIWKELAEKYHNQVKLIPGMDQVIKELAKDYTLAIMSNNNADRIEFDLKKFGLHDHFKYIVGLNAQEGKPKPDGLIRCMKFLNFKPEETIFIGDMQGDVLAAKNANLKKSIAVTFGFNSRKVLAKANPDCILDKPEQILDEVE